MVSFTEAIKICLFKKYATMSGRASRAEYWWFQLFFWIVTLFIVFIGNIIDDNDFTTITVVVYMIFFILTLIPNLCVFVRRLHDRGHSGAIFWWALLISIWGVLLIGNIINMFGSDEDENEYGPNPLKPNINDDLGNLGESGKMSGLNDTKVITDVNL